MHTSHTPGREKSVAPKADDYTDLQLRVFSRQAGQTGYRVEAALDDGSRFEGQLSLDNTALAGLAYDASAYGQALFAALIAGEVRTAYDRAMAQAELRTEGRLRVRLWLDASDLQALPWERLYHPFRGQRLPLTTSTLTPFSRYTSLEAAEFAPVTARPLRLLLVLANPVDLPAGLKPVPVEDEVESVREALSVLRCDDQIQVTLLPGRSGLKPAVHTALKAEGWQIVDGPVSLEQLARQLPGQHILHLVGHGYTQPDSDRGPAQTALYLEKDEGTLQIVKAADLVARLAAIGQLPHLVFLMACESAAPQTPTAHPFIGLGPQLVQAGVPAVVAMQAQVPIAMSRPFTSEFYRRLVEHGEVDKAMSQARLAVFRPDRVDWAVPVLFMRLRDGRLFAKTTEKPKEADVPKRPVKQSGGVNISGASHVTIGGDVVGGDKITTTTNYGVSAGALADLFKQFQSIKQQIDQASVDADIKEDLQTNVKRIEDEVKKGDQADPGKVERWLIKIGAMSDDIFQVTAATLLNPVYGVAKTLQLIVQKAKEEQAKLNPKK
jgi:hypothetical protein